MKRWMLVLVLLVVAAMVTVCEAQTLTTDVTPRSVGSGGRVTFTVGLETEPWAVIFCRAVLTTTNLPEVEATAGFNVGQPLYGAALAVPTPPGTEAVEATATTADGATVTVPIPPDGSPVTFLFGDITPGQAVALAVVLAVM